MAESAKRTERLSDSDKLGVVLACLAGVMGIILFLVPKTPATVAVLLVAMVGLSVYPILHFVRRSALRIGTLCCVVLATTALGCYVWPETGLSNDQSDTSAQPSNNANNRAFTKGWLKPKNSPVPDCSNSPKGRLFLLHGGNTSWDTEFPRTVIGFKDQNGVVHRNLVIDKEESGRIAVTMDIFGPDGKIIARIEKNHFTVNPNNYFDTKIEEDGSTLQVWDQSGREVLFISYLNSCAIKVRALLYFPGNRQIKITNDDEVIGSMHISGNSMGSGNFGDILVQ